MLLFKGDWVSTYIRGISKYKIAEQRGEEKGEDINGKLRGRGCDGISDSQTCTSRIQLINPVCEASQSDLWAIMRGVCVIVCENKKLKFIDTHTYLK